MKRLSLPIFLSSLFANLFLFACASAPVQDVEPAATLGRLADFRADSAAHGCLLELPRFERTPAEVAATVDRVLFDAQTAVRRIGKLAEAASKDKAARREITFASAIAAVDDGLYPLTTVMNRIYLMKETQQDAVMRQACTEQVTRMEAWLVDVSTDPGLYRAASIYTERLKGGEVPILKGEDAQYHSDMMRDYRSNGFAPGMTAELRAEVAVLKKEMNALATQFDTNITNAQVALLFPEEELAGVPNSFMQAAKQSDGMYRVRVTVTPDYMAVIQNCSVAETRKKINHARYSVLKDENGSILNEMVAVRHAIAQKLGYATWADYKIEPKMAGDAKTAIAFMERLSDGLQPKFDAEVERLRQLKVVETGDDAAQINWWDFRYYQNKLLREKYGVDSSELRNYFPLEKVLDGMFGVYEHIFGLEFVEIEPGYKWIDDLRLFIVQDTQTREPLGAFYLDLFPREGKYNHFAQFDIVSGKRHQSGCYQRPVVSLVCNFTPGLDGEPALMNHGEVETIFHEFGHAMHSILTRANFSSLSGANVARDFVEAPSQMFEAWAWDPVILKRFAYDWRNTENSIPEETLKAMKAANLATKGIHYRRQIGLALADLQMHNGPVQDAGALCNEVNAKALFAVPEGTNFAATFGHLTGYDAGYYGYAWADAIAADMATVFEQAPDRFLDKGVGRRLRDEIYAVGGTKPAAEAVRAFLGRERSIDAFLKTIGL